MGNRIVRIQPHPKLGKQLTIIEEMIDFVDSIVDSELVAKVNLAGILYVVNNTLKRDPVSFSRKGEVVRVVFNEHDITQHLYITAHNEEAAELIVRNLEEWIEWRTKQKT